MQTGTVREFVRAFSILMLDIRDMFEKDKMFYFLEGLKSWVRTELQRQRVQDVATAMAAVECLNDYSEAHQNVRHLHQMAVALTLEMGGRPPGWTIL